MFKFHLRFTFKVFKVSEENKGKFCWFASFFGLGKIWASKIFEPDPGQIILNSYIPNTTGK